MKDPRDKYLSPLRGKPHNLSFDHIVTVFVLRLGIKDPQERRAVELLAQGLIRTAIMSASLKGPREALEELDEYERRTAR